ncbi:hypothetical protein K435DRAFT_773795 [Dendrothele bispora CBS 962.96]|uniref:Manganese/iron superoxide dismutase C-terminal domain-containing protein n=1 Tax=Dendrothele bispora (strain CBS 962.96) TaxID=1314807 RepID=A0A4S8MQL8_DENBC|nr:hypothetical protein K435DRAFT_773795 [Dendrothele bispora CBS 962.96]
MRRFLSPLSISKTSSTKWVHPIARHGYVLGHGGRRALHYPPPLSTRVEQGLGNFLPPPAYKIVAVDYQQGLLQRLNEEVKGTEMEGFSVVDTIIKTAPERSNVLAFNYASLALNNHFFLSQLSPPPPSSSSPSSSPSSYQHLISLDLHSEIRNQHGSLAQLKSAFSATAMGMFTNGFVWFVTNAAGNTAIIPTFGPGTLLVRSRTYMGHSKELLVGEGMLQWQRGDPLEEGDLYMEEWKGELQEMVTGVKSGQQQVEVDYEQEAETADVNASSSSPRTTTSPPPPPPPGTSPSSPVSGVSSGNSSQTPSSPPNSRSLHTSSILSNSKFTNQTPSSLWDTPPSTSSSSPYSLNNSPYQQHYPKTKSRNDQYTMAMGEETFYPLFCVSVHEHAWLAAGYGVWGKERWLKEFWNVLDWEKVSRAYDGYKVKSVERDVGF